MVPIIIIEPAAAGITRRSLTSSASILWHGVREQIIWNTPCHHCGTLRPSQHYLHSYDSTCRPFETKTLTYSMMIIMQSSKFVQYHQQMTMLSPLSPSKPLFHQTILHWK